MCVCVCGEIETAGPVCVWNYMLNLSTVTCVFCYILLYKHTRGGVSRTGVAGRSLAGGRAGGPRENGGMNGEEGLMPLGMS